MIDDISVTPLKRIQHDKGDIYHAMKSSEDSFSSFGEAYFSSVNFADVKGWKKHSKMILNLIVPIGAVRFVAYDDRISSKTYQQFFDITISKENYCRLTIPHGLWLAFQGVGREFNLLLNIASIEHDPNESVSCELGDIKYNWDSM